MQNLGDMLGWVEMETTHSLPFSGERAREVVIVVNTPDKTLFAVQPVVEDGEVYEPMFLARVEGYDTIKFNVPAGPFELIRIDGGAHVAHIRTADGVKQHRENIGVEKFTEIHVRRQLSPEYQMILDQVQKNSMRNMNMMGAEIEQLRRQVRDAQLRTPSAPAAGPSGQEQATIPATPPVSPVGTGSEGQGGNEGGQ